MSQGDTSIVEGLFAAIADGDREAALRLAHPEIVWTPTVWSGSSTLRGRGAVRSWFDQFGTALEHLEVHASDIRQANGCVVALGTVHDSRDSGSFATRVGWIFVVETGMVREGRAYGSWGEALEAGGLPAESEPTGQTERESVE